jgi:hypothetical protein
LRSQDLLNPCESLRRFFDVDDNSPTPDRLVVDSAWLRSLARRLVGPNERRSGLRNFALLGARHRSHGVTDFRMLQGDPPDGSAHKVTLRFTDQQAAPSQ